jgi:hypothetical protein
VSISKSPEVIQDIRDFISDKNVSRESAEKAGK